VLSSAWLPEVAEPATQAAWQEPGGVRAAEVLGSGAMNLGTVPGWPPAGGSAYTETHALPIDSACCP